MQLKPIIIFLATIFILSACSNDPEETNSANEGSVAEASEENSSTESPPTNDETEKREPEEVLEEGDHQPATEEQLAEAEKPQSPEEFLEMSRVKEEIDVSAYDMQIITDNPGTRVIVYMEGDEQIYKSIYIKRNALFKLIDLQASEPVVLEELQ